MAVTSDAAVARNQTEPPDMKIVGGADFHARENDNAGIVRRPWGHFQSVLQGHRYQVKRLLVVPGGVLSLQHHHHRSEHWVVVKGTARVTVGADAIMVAEGHSVHIPLGADHRVENPGKIELEIIEVQTGAYLGEDDIVRISDVYGRAGQGAAPAGKPVARGA